MLLFDRENWVLHRPWAAFCGGGTLGAVVYYLIYSQGRPDWPGGSSLPGMVFGTLGGLIIVFELLLWPRKWPKLRAWRILGRTQVWMRAHIWLGLLSVPLVLLHTGFQWGGWLSTTLAVLFIVVISSGIYGLALQQFLPRRLLLDVPAETIYSQINHVSRQLAADAERLVRATCGNEALVRSLPDGSPQQEFDEQTERMPQVIGAVRSIGKTRGRVLHTELPPVLGPSAELLQSAFESVVRPFLLQGPHPGCPLNHIAEASRLFDDLRARLPASADVVIESLESSCSTRRQFDEQSRLHVWLHGWLQVHLPLSVLLVLLLALHVYVALRYW